MSTPERATSSLLVVDHGQSDVAVLLDAGTGVAMLLRQPELLGSAERLEVVLSHFHLDHVAGLTYLPALQSIRAVDITIWAPGHLLLDRDSCEILRTLVAAPFLSVELRELARVRELAAGDNQIGAGLIAARVQRCHPGGSIAFRLVDELAYCTDTAPDPDSAAFVQGVATLVHEAWSVYVPSHEHSSAASAATTAAEAGVGRLVLSHINPVDPAAGDPAALLRAATPIFPSTEEGYDGLAIGRGGCP